jgi:hypothetical protein
MSAITQMHNLSKVHYSQYLRTENEQGEEEVKTSEPVKPAVPAAE